MKDEEEMVRLGRIRRGFHGSLRLISGMAVPRKRNMGGREAEYDSGTRRSLNCTQIAGTVVNYGGSRSRTSLLTLLPEIFTTIFDSGSMRPRTF